MRNSVRSVTNHVHVESQSGDNLESYSFRLPTGLLTTNVDRNCIGPTAGTRRDMTFIRDLRTDRSLRAQIPKRHVWHFGCSRISK